MWPGDSRAIFAPGERVQFRINKLAQFIRRARFAIAERVQEPDNFTHTAEIMSQSFAFITSRGVMTEPRGTVDLSVRTAARLPRESRLRARRIVEASGARGAVGVACSILGAVPLSHPTPSSHTNNRALKSDKEWGHSYRRTRVQRVMP